MQNATESGMRASLRPQAPANKFVRIGGLVCLLAVLCAAPAAFAQQYSWDDVPRIVAISDPHGAYDAMVR
jgi:hypothetical protein